MNKEFFKQLILGKKNCEVYTYINKETQQPKEAFYIFYTELINRYYVVEVDCDFVDAERYIVQMSDYFSEIEHCRLWILRELTENYSR